MNLIGWQESLRIGVEGIDAQHREMFARFSALIAACMEGKGRERIAELFAFLEEYVSTHFADEERLLAEIAFPDSARHREAHRQFTERLTGLFLQFERDGATLALVVETNRMLVNWLVEHISGMDREIARFLQEPANRERIPPVV